MHKLESVLENKTHEILSDFRDINDSPNFDLKTRTNFDYKKIICHLGDLTFQQTI